MKPLPMAIIVLCLTLCIPSVAVAQRPDPLNDPASEQRVNDLLQRMTLEEKAGQLNQFSFGQATGPGTGRTAYPEMVAAGRIGSILNLVGAKETNDLQRVAVEQSRLKIPLLFGLDVIHGYRTIFPVPIGLASTWDMELIERSARSAAQEASAAGVRWTFSPMLDIARDPRWGRVVESPGEDPYLASRFARAFVRGYQGERLSTPDAIAATGKHFVGYGAAEGGRDYNTAEISERTLRQVYLPPFRAAAAAGAATMMSAFNTIDAVPASASRFALARVLREEWGFRGAVVSDWTSVAELIPHGIALDGPMAAQKALLAGVDIDMESNLYGPHLPELVRAGRVPQAAVDEAVRRVLRVKFALGLFEQPYADTPAPAGPLRTERLALAREAAEKSMVLLKNGPPENRPALLPLSSRMRTVAVIGPFADNAQEMLGSWHAQGKAEDVVTLLAALRARSASDGTKLLYARGTEILADSEAGFPEAQRVAQQADVILLALGEKADSMTAEAASRTRLDLPGNQQRLLEAIVKTGKPIVLILFTGRPLVLTWAQQNVTAIMQAWYPGVQAGPALARILFGETSPSGRLTVSFPRHLGQVPLYYNQLNTGRPADGIDLDRPPQNAEEKYKSRYIDERNDALFPFGYGLAYSTFAYSTPTVNAKSISAAALNAGTAKVRVSATVRNTGKIAADEVVQMYIRQRGTSVARPLRELKGFARVTLAPGQSQDVMFELGREELAFWNVDMKEVVEPAQVTVWIAANSASGVPAEFTITASH